MHPETAHSVLPGGLNVPGAQLAQLAREDAKARSILWEGVITHANPLPSADEWLWGINRKSDRGDAAGQKWEPVRAIHSNIMLSLTRLQMAIARSPWRA